METKDLRLVMEYVSVLWWATWVARWFLEWTLLDVCQFLPSVLREKLSYCCLLAWICQESLSLSNQYQCSKTMNQKVSSAFVDIFRSMFSAFDLDATRKPVIMTTASNKHSLDTRNGQFSHLLVISLHQSNVVQDDYRRGRLGRPKWWNGSTNGTGRSITTLISVS